MLTKQAAEEARKDGIIIFAIGVGKGVRDEELLNIAGDNSRVTKVENYNQLDSIQDVLATKTCISQFFSFFFSFSFFVSANNIDWWKFSCPRLCHFYLNTRALHKISDIFSWKTNNVRLVSSGGEV